MNQKPNITVTKYALPGSMIHHDVLAITRELVDAKAAVLSLQTIPYQREWVEELQKIELKREVAGTSRIEGAQFTEKELEAALRESPEQLLTRSQRQARAAVHTYRWIATLPQNLPITAELMCQIHRHIVTGADDDHCEPGRLRSPDQNVIFGIPPHRGAEGGEEVQRAFAQLAAAIPTEFRAHDPLIQALAAHCHVAAIHPFLDGNGRTARALEALMLQRAGLRDTCFIAMSNYYYDEKPDYLAALNAVRAGDHDLTPFLKFALRGVASQSRRLLDEIRHHVSKALFRNLMFDLFGRLRTRRTRVIAERQIEILKLLLGAEELELDQVVARTTTHYERLKSPRKAVIRDLTSLITLQAITVRKAGDGKHRIAVRLEWPTEITESKFFEYVRSLPKAKSHPFLW